MNIKFKISAIITVISVLSSGIALAHEPSSETSELINNLSISDYVIETDSVSDTDITAASTHRHSYRNYSEGMRNNEYHKIIRRCSVCGEVKETSTQKHISSKSSDYISQIPNNNRYHNKYFICSKCGEQFPKQVVHRFVSTKEYRYNDIDNTYHEVIIVCKDCGYEKRETKKHTISNGTCKYCGHSNSVGVAAATRDGDGVCSVQRVSSLGDKWVYAKCPKCGSSDWRFDYRETIRTNVAQVWGRRATIYHQHVICNNGNCGKKYTNRCYLEYN